MSSSPMGGRSISSSRRTSGRPGLRQTNAFISCPSGMGDRQDRSAELERRIFIGDQEKGIAVDAVAPAEHTNDEAEETLRIPAREDKGEPGHDHPNQGTDSEEEQHDVVGER